MTVSSYRFKAFISYSHRDQTVAKWLHGALESYRVPQRLVGKETGTGTIARRIGPVFRDRDELPVASDLSGKINEALASTQFLIVLCSPASAQSKWVNQEVINFKRLKGEDSIIAVVLGGEPFASGKPGREAEECFVPALRFRVDADGALTDQPAEPIAADLRPDKDSKRLVKLKVIAGLLGLGLDELVRRENQRRTQRLFWLSTGMATAMMVMGVLTVFAIQSRNEAVIARDDAERQKTQAEDLIEFMLGDLRGKLQPVGRLDALDSVGEKSLAYFASLKPSELDDNTLGRKARALHLLGEIRDLRGDFDGALRVFEDARDTTLKLMQADPLNEQRMFEHAQSEYWIGYEYFNKGHLPKAEESILAYKNLTDELVARSPSNTKWQKERGHAEINMGVILLQQGKHLLAIDSFESARTVFTTISDGDPNNIEVRTILAQCYAWLADASATAGQLNRAENYRQNEAALYDQLTLKDPQNKDLARAKLVAYKSLGVLRADKGDQHGAITALEVASSLATMLEELDPDNTLWMELSGRSALDMAEALIESGLVDRAREAFQKGLAISDALIRKDPNALNWQVSLRGKALVLQARMANSAVENAAASHQLDELIAYLDGLALEQRDSADVTKLMAKTLLFGGDVKKRLGKVSTAKDMWTKGAALLVDRGDKMAASSKVDLAHIYQRLSEPEKARSTAREAMAMGYASPSIVRIASGD
jgi:tetratricopeptide (TPR) repeat protein